MTESFEDAIKALRHISRGNGSVMRIADRIVAAHERETKVEGVCGPITGELRAAMRQWGWVESDGSITFATSPTPPSIDAEQSLAISGSDFDRYCDAIDSIHAQLERENAALKSSAAHAYASGYEYAEMDRDGWIELPRDADGKPVHIDDVMEWPTTCETFEVVGVGDGVLFYVEDGEEKADWTGASTKRHHAPDTWERILADALGCEPYEVEGDDDLMALVARCKALAGDAE